LKNPKVVPVLNSVDDYLKFCVQYDASDLHLATASPPIWRRYGNLQPIWESSTHRAANLTAEDSKRLAYGFLSEAQIKQLETKGGCGLRLFASLWALSRLRSAAAPRD